MYEIILAGFKFGDFLQNRQFTKLKTLPKFPAIRYFTYMTCCIYGATGDVLSRSQKTVTFPFCSAPSERKGATHSVHKKQRRDGTGEGGWAERGNGNGQNVRMTRPTVVSLNKMPEESKKAERSTISVDLSELATLARSIVYS